MRLIDADALIPMMKYITTDNEIGVFPIRIGFDAIKRVIDDAPTIDAVEVVRCKDCRYGHMTYSGTCKYCDIWFEDGEALYLDGGFYCGFGKRREESEA